MTTEADRPNLSMGQPPGALRRQAPRVAIRGFRLLLALHLAVLAGVVWILARPAARMGTGVTGPAAADPHQLRTIAMELEDRSLSSQAAEAWEAYLAAEPDTKNRAEILYRAGKLYFDAERYDEAAGALVRAQLAGSDDADLRAKIAPKLVDCLRRLGLYGEVGRELSRQVEVGAEDTGRGEVLATLAGEPLTEADLDRMIQRRVDQMLAEQGAEGNQAARQEILRQLATPAMRQRMLEDLLRTELLARRARDLKLDRQPAFRQARQLMEQNLLANQLMRQQLEKIQPTDVDLESYYQAHRQAYEEPESMDLVLIELADGEDPTAVLNQVQSADDFRQLARNRLPGDEKPDEPPVHRVIRGRPDPKLGDTSPLFQLAEGQWTKEPHAAGEKKYLALVQSKTEARIAPLEEVRQRVLNEYVQRKRQELSEKLLHDLMTRYDVRIVPPKKPEGKEEKEEDGQKGRR